MGEAVIFIALDGFFEIGNLVGVFKIFVKVIFVIFGSKGGDFSFCNRFGI